MKSRAPAWPSESSGGVRPTRELVGIAARRVFGRVRLERLSWVRVDVGVPSLRLVKGEPPSGGFLFRWSRRGEGVEIAWNRAQALMVLDQQNILDPTVFELGGRIVKLSDLESRRFWKRGPKGEAKDSFLRHAWKIRREARWEICKHPLCMGGRHELRLSPKGAESPFHTHEELGLLELFGEGCGKVFREWREGRYGEVGYALAERRFQEKAHLGPEDRWIRAVSGLVREELLVAGFAGAEVGEHPYMREQIRCYLPAIDADVFLGKVRGPRSWYEEVWKRGLRAEPGRFPDDVLGESVRWLLLDGSYEREPIEKALARARA